MAKTAFAAVLPPAVLSHPKQGFMIPLGDWLRGDLRPVMEALLAMKRAGADGILTYFALEVARELKKAR